MPRMNEMEENYKSTQKQMANLTDETEKLNNYCYRSGKYESQNVKFSSYKLVHA